MSGATTAAMVGMAAVAAAGTAASMYSANKQAKAQDRATRQAEENAKKQAEQSAQATRRQQQNRADVSGILSMNQDGGLSGGSTLLSGAGGVNKNQMSLGGGSTLG
ncbi:hypothetical protein [uncultured Duodenibacillus sp.]|jgi:hypothetical protein|uniref:Uncharacterized protein n=1 Tax=Podoviridae sp. ct9P15 TaxID=2826543 RepID=A0A8S5MFG3_9CAUD|nr:hypothetical protein [uncultured Duodenibacillus sp.]DAD80962.1 MAG TPA: hypothetical protein [Podoviridae sp. ct9P15]